MDILGVGPLELFFILLIALIVLGPNDMVKAGRTIGKFLRRIVTSSDWRTIQQASRDIRYLPNRLMRDAGLDDLEEEIKKDLPVDETLRKQIGVDELRDEMKNWQKDMADWTTPPSAAAEPESKPEQEVSEEGAVSSPEQASDSRIEEEDDAQTKSESEPDIVNKKLEESENN